MNRGKAPPSSVRILSRWVDAYARLHGVPPKRGIDTPNERFRDLVDLLLLRALVVELGEIRTACLKVFSMRGTHQWPPLFEPPPFWEEPFSALAKELNLPVQGFNDAATRVRTFIAEIDAAV